MGTRVISLSVCLLAFWLALSGHYTAFLIAMGVLSTAFVVWMARRMGTLDAEGHPIHMLPGAVTYMPWLFVEMAKSGWSLTRAVWSPSLPISPVMMVVDASQKTAVGLNVYANSITLTPGTMTVAVSGNRLTVHALNREGADDLEAGAMDRRVTAFEAAAMGAGERGA